MICDKSYYMLLVYIIFNDVIFNERISDIILYYIKYYNILYYIKYVSTCVISYDMLLNM